MVNDLLLGDSPALHKSQSSNSPQSTRTVLHALRCKSPCTKCRAPKRCLTCRTSTTPARINRLARLSMCCRGIVKKLCPFASYIDPSVRPPRPRSSTPLPPLVPLGSVALRTFPLLSPFSCSLPHSPCVLLPPPHPDHHHSIAPVRQSSPTTSAAKALRHSGK